jgi:chromosome segregation ATPase
MQSYILQEEDTTQLKEKVQAYEARIKSLEQLLKTSYAAQRQGIDPTRLDTSTVIKHEEFSMIKAQNQQLQMRVSELEHESMQVEDLRGEMERLNSDIDEHLRMNQATRRELETERQANQTLEQAGQASAQQLEIVQHQLVDTQHSRQATLDELEVARVKLQQVLCHDFKAMLDRHCTS